MTTKHNARVARANLYVAQKAMARAAGGRENRQIEVRLGLQAEKNRIAKAGKAGKSAPPPAMEKTAVEAVETIAVTEEDTTREEPKDPAE